MAANFPDSPTINDTTIIDGIKYSWNGNEWTIVTGSIQNAVVQSDDGTVDLSKGSYHKISIDENNLTVPISFTNISSGSSRWTLEFDIQAVDILYDLENASYDNVSFSVTSQETSPQGIFFKPDGTKMYIIGTVSDSVHQYTLSTPWDVSTASYDSISFSVGGQESGPQGIFFKSDGAKMYIVGSGNSRRVYQYTLSTPWDLSTASYDSVNFDYQTQAEASTGLFFKPDGTKMYIIGSDSDTVYQYSLSTAYNVSTASYDSISFDVGGQETSPRGIFFKPDGNKMYIVGSGNSTVYQYTLSTAWNLSTVSYDSVSFSVTSQDLSSRDVFFKPDGTKMYIIGNDTDSVYQYSIGVVYDLSVSWSNTIIWNENTAPTILKNQNLILEFYTPDGGTTIYGIEAINKDNT